MGPEQLVFFVPITAIVMGIGAGIVKSVLATYERIQLAKTQAAAMSGQMNDRVVAELRDEIAKLRDTTTQHAISLQQTVDRLDHRVEFLEQKSIGAPVEPVEYVQTAPNVQIAGRA